MKIKTIRRLSCQTRVHDIQTGTENFFAEGVLVHNCNTDALLLSMYSGSCPVNCPFCLSPDSLVDTPVGQVRIDRLTKGDKVWGRTKNGFVWAEVIAISIREVSEFYILKTNTAKFRVTGNHPVYVVDKGWTRVDSLSMGEEVETVNLQSYNISFDWDKYYYGDTQTIERNQVLTVSSSAVTEITKVNETLVVWDIQTTSENFYCEGHLFHNCYVQNGVRGWRGSGITVVDPTYPDKIRKQVSRMRTATAFYMSSFIDPFLELEPIYHNTQRTAKVAIDNGLPMFFLTRKEVPGWAYDYLKQNKYSYMQFSINTSDHEDWKKLSPKAAPLQTMFDQVREMHCQGIYVSIQVNPICAGITSNDQIVDLIHILAKNGADHLIFKFVEIVYPSRKGMVDNMKKRWAKDGRGEKFDQLFTQTIGGFYTIDEDYRKLALERFSRECKKAGVTMALCYEYEYERDAKGNILSKTGVSMGHRYLTADQCHGHRVPVFSRDTVEEPWKEIKGCPPAGCLTCQDIFPKETPCHNDFLASAPAWKPADLNRPAMLPKGSQKKTEDGKVALKVLGQSKTSYGRQTLELVSEKKESEQGGCGSGSCGCG